MSVERVPAARCVQNTERPLRNHKNSEYPPLEGFRAGVEAGEHNLDIAHPLEQEIGYLARKALLLPKDEDYHSPELQRYYLAENMITFITEHAGRIPIKTLKGFIREDGRMEILRTDIIAMAENAYHTRVKKLTEEYARYGLPVPVEVARSQREWYELQGMKKLQELFARGYNRVDIVSPPKGADYHMVFSFQKGGYDPKRGGWDFQETVFTVSDTTDSLDRSHRTAELLAKRYGAARPENHAWYDFIRYPIAGYKDGPNDLLDTARDLGYTQEDVRYSERYELELRNLIKSELEEYVNLLIAAANEPTRGGARYEQLMRRAVCLRDRMFSLGKQLRRELLGMAQEEGVVTLAQIAAADRRNPQYERLMMLLTSQNRAVITGTLCPSAALGGSTSLFSTAAGSGSSFFSTSAMLFEASARSSNSPERDGVYEACVTCPHCKVKSGSLLGGKTIRHVRIVRSGITRYKCGNSACSSNKKRGKPRKAFC